MNPKILADLRAKLATLKSQSEAQMNVIAVRTEAIPTDDEEKILAALDVETVSIRAKIKSAEGRLKEIQERALEDEAAATAAASGTQTAAADPEDETRSGKAPKNLQVDVKQDKGPVFRHLGEQLIAIAHVSTPSTPRDLREQAYNRLQEMHKRAPQGLSTLVDADGGYAIQNDIAAGIFSMAWDQGVFTSRCDSTPLSTNAQALKMLILKEDSRVRGSRWGGVTASWVQEAGAATASKPGLKQLIINVDKIMAVGYATDENLQDAAALGDLMVKGFTEEIAFELDNAVLYGTGVNQPLGILSSACKAVITVAIEAGQTLSGNPLDALNIIKMRKFMSPRSRAKACWFYNIDLEDQFPKLKLATGSSSGQLVYMPAGGLTGSEYDLLYNRPLIPTEFNAAMGTVGDIIYCDFSYFKFVKKGDIQTESSIHVSFLTDEQVFKVKQRIGGKPVIEVPITPYKGSTQTSPFVALAARTG